MGINKKLSDEEIEEAYQQHIFQDIIKQNGIAMAIPFSKNIIWFYCKCRLGVTSLWNVYRIMPTFLSFVNRFTQTVRFNAHLTFKCLDDFYFKY